MTPKQEQKHTDLLPCPFCGGAPYMRKHAGIVDMVRCAVCRFQLRETQWNTRKADCHEELVALREFAESFSVIVTDSHYKDVYLNLHSPHALSMRIANDSSKSWIFADLEKRRLSALTRATAKEAAPNDGEG